MGDGKSHEPQDRHDWNVPDPDKSGEDLEGPSVFMANREFGV